MLQCVSKGLNTEGILDSGLNVTRRAPALLKTLESNHALTSDPIGGLAAIHFGPPCE
ncbi:hypothetical protein IUZ65_009450 [Vibrio sp. VB16]|nr:hypothetical protein [Vibrio sp. VB16]UGA53531.1 hypothetical protein IUZ65_009450 [Vibrio sp. VB16]